MRRVLVTTLMWGFILAGTFAQSSTQPGPARQGEVTYHGGHASSTAVPISPAQQATQPSRTTPGPPKTLVQAANSPNPQLAAVQSLFQIAFFIVVGSITILTYLKARETLLQPLKTEVFKEQLKELSSVMARFSGKQEVDLRNECAFDTLFTANAFLLMDNYARSFFDLKTDREKRPYNTEVCPTALAMAEALEVCDEYMAEQEPDLSACDPNPRVVAAKWGQYQHSIMPIPKEYSDAYWGLGKLMESPLMPRQCLALLEEYRSLISENTEILRGLLTECATELPDKYPNADSLKKASISWIHTRYMERFKDLKPGADRITDFIRDYFGTDSIARDLQTSARRHWLTPVRSMMKHG